MADAVHRGDIDDIRDELGDLLLQVVFQSRIAEESGLFSLADVARSISDKMVERHPHVFGDDARPQVAEQTGRWEAIGRGAPARATPVFLMMSPPACPDAARPRFSARARRL